MEEGRNLAAHLPRALGLGVRGCTGAGDGQDTPELRGKPGAAEDRRRWSLEEGGAARRPRERRGPRAAVAGGQAGGGGGGGAHLECGGDAHLLLSSSLTPVSCCFRQESCYSLGRN
jgi:hypothetical protein